MSIWIKSQDGGLGEYNKFLPPLIRHKEVDDPDSPFLFKTSEVIHARIMGCDAIGNLDILGTYPTESEALDVIARIYKHINELYLLSIQGYADFKDGPIYRMPAAGFSKEE